MSRRIEVRISPAGETSVEAHGFHGKGCEAATKAIEASLGRVGRRTRKPDFWQLFRRRDQPQQLGGEAS